MKNLLSSLLTVALLAGVAYALPPEAPRPVPVDRQPWSEDVISLFQTLPIQDGGRIKPLDTHASFLLLRLNGKRTAEDLQGNRLTPMEWFLDCLFYPELARQYKTFVVDTYEVLDAIGVSTEGHKRRDRYSFNELEPGIPRLMGLIEQIREIDAAKRDPLQTQIADLGSNVFEFQSLIHYFDFARSDFSAVRSSPLSVVAPQPNFTGLLQKATVIRVMTILLDMGVEQLASVLPEEEMARLRQQIPPEFANLDENARQQGLQSLEQAVGQIVQLGNFARSMALIPPADPEVEVWLSPGTLAEKALMSDEDVSASITVAASLEKLPALVEQPEAFTNQLQQVHNDIVGRATTRGEYGRIPLEVFFYKAKFFFWSQWTYVLCFGLTALMWLKPDIRLGFGKFKLPVAGALLPAMLTVPTILLVAGITVRCIIRGRPPVTTLYETILFITACAVIVSLIIEYMNRQGLALSLASILGTMGMFLANKYEIKEGIDTMPSLIAVLDTNFWLSTHVTIVTMGYAAGLLAAAIAHVYILGKVIGIKKDDKTFYKNVVRMTYGVVCFCLLFSTVGTILGGIWANDSWGRFWGWDPKENGALMICLWMLAILHARMGGYIRDLGVCVAAVVGGMVIAFSWWGVNLLGVGLHSYGFTSGVLRALVTFYAVETVVVLLGLSLWGAGKFGGKTGGLRTQT